MEINQAKIWAFVMEYYPDYDSCSHITYADDLQKILEAGDEGNLTGEALEIRRKFGSDMDAILTEYREVHCAIYEKAIQGYINQNSL